MRGEIYEVDDDLMNFFDDKEGYPEWYDRRKVRIRLEDTTTTTDNANAAETVIECWLYILTTFRREMRDLEKYENYDSGGSHGKRFVELYDAKGDLMIPLEDVEKEFSYWFCHEDK